MHTSVHPAFVTNHYFEIEGRLTPFELTKWGAVGHENPKGDVHTSRGSIKLASGQRAYAEYPWEANNGPKGDQEAYIREWDDLNEPRKVKLLITDDVDDPLDPRSLKRIYDLGSCQLGNITYIPEGDRSSPTVSIMSGELLPEYFELIYSGSQV